MLSCLAWSNYNFVITLFTLYIWTRRKDILALSFMLSLSVLLMFYDLTFLIVEIRLWTQQDLKDPAWSKSASMLNIAIVCFFAINLIRIALLINIKWAINVLQEQQQIDDYHFNGKQILMELK